MSDTNVKFFYGRNFLISADAVNYPKMSLWKRIPSISWPCGCGPSLRLLSMATTCALKSLAMPSKYRYRPMKSSPDVLQHVRKTTVPIRSISQSRKKPR